MRPNAGDTQSGRFKLRHVIRVHLVIAEETLIDYVRAADGAQARTGTQVNRMLLVQSGWIIRASRQRAIYGRDDVMPRLRRMLRRIGVGDS